MGTQSLRWNRFIKHNNERAEQYNYITHYECFWKIILGHSGQEEIKKIKILCKQYAILLSGSLVPEKINSALSSGYTSTQRQRFASRNSTRLWNVTTSCCVFDYLRLSPLYWLFVFQEKIKYRSQVETFFGDYCLCTLLYDLVHQKSVDALYTNSSQLTLRGNYRWCDLQDLDLWRKEIPSNLWHVDLFPKIKWTWSW